MSDLTRADLRVHVGDVVCPLCRNGAETQPATRKQLEQALRAEGAEEVNWCIEHNSPTGDRIIHGASCFLAIEESLWVNRCRFVTRLLLKVEDR